MTRSYIFCIIAIFFFSTKEVVTKIFDDQMSPLVFTFSRFLIGSLIILPIAYLRNREQFKKLKIRDLWYIGYPGILNVAIAMFSLQLAVYYGRASLSGILVSSNPIFVAIFAALILKEHLSFKKIIGIIIGIIGIIIIIGGEAGTDARNLILGVIFGCLSSISFGLYTVISKKYVIKYGNLTFNGITFLCGSIFLLITALFIGVEFSIKITTINLMALFYLGVFVSGISYLLFFQGVRNIPTANGSIFFLLKPVIVVVLSYFLLKETIDISQVYGLFLVITSIYINNYSRAPVREKLLSFTRNDKLMKEH